MKTPNDEMEIDSDKAKRPKQYLRMDRSLHHPSMPVQTPVEDQVTLVLRLDHKSKKKQGTRLAERTAEGM